MNGVEALALQRSRLTLPESANLLICAFDIYRKLPAPPEAKLAWLPDETDSGFIVGAIAEHPDSVPERTPKSYLIVGQDGGPKIQPDIEFITEFDKVDDLAWLQHQYRVDEFDEGERLGVALSHLAFFALRSAIMGKIRNKSARLVWGITNKRRHLLQDLHDIDPKELVRLSYDKVDS